MFIKKKSQPTRGQGGPPIPHPQKKSYLFCDLKPYAKFQNTTITPSGRKVTRAETKKEKNAINSGHLIPWQRTQAARTKNIFFSSLVLLFLCLYLNNYNHVRNSLQTIWTYLWKLWKLFMSVYCCINIYGSILLYKYLCQYIAV